MVPAERPSLNDSAKAISALLCLQRAFSMQNLVAPPMPTIRPIPWMMLYIEMEKLSAARPSAPIALAMKKVSARM